LSGGVFYFEPPCTLSAWGCTYNCPLAVNMAPNFFSALGVYARAPSASLATPMGRDGDNERVGRGRRENAEREGKEGEGEAADPHTSLYIQLYSPYRQPQ